MLVNHKRVARLMREDNLLAVQPRTFRSITDSARDLGAGAGPRAAAPAIGACPSFRSRCAVRLGRVRGACPGARHDSEYESAGEPLRQRELRKLCEDPQAGGDLCEYVSNVRTPRHKHR